MRYVIIGGVAAGATAATRLRRRDESAEIILLEKNNVIAYANCGLPYHLGGIIPDRENLIVMTPERMRKWYNIDVRTVHEVTAIDRLTKTLAITTPTGESVLRYDKLLLAPGATPILPEGLPSSNRLHHLWTLSDMDGILAQLPNVKHVAIIGAGFVGLETAESLRERGLNVSLIQREAHVLTTIDGEMAHRLHKTLRNLGINLYLNTSIDAYTPTDKNITLTFKDGATLECDLAIMTIGVRPRSELAQKAGLPCGARGHIIVNEYLQTIDPDIYAAGDAIEVRDPLFGGATAIPLAGPANKQGRIAADNMLGDAIPYPGSYGTSILKLGNLSAASVGYTENRLKAFQQPYQKLYLHPNTHATYYPGAEQLTIKVLFSPEGRLYGAQIVGEGNVDKRIDVFAQALQTERNITELSTLELAYAPPYNSVKDPLNVVGFIAQNILSGKSNIVHADHLPTEATLVDVREPQEFARGAIPGAINLPLSTLREHIMTLDKTKSYVLYCQVGLRGYLAERILKQHGFDVANLSGGWLSWKLFNPET